MCGSDRSKSSWRSFGSTATALLGSSVRDSELASHDQGRHFTLRRCRAPARARTWRRISRRPSRRRTATPRSWPRRWATSLALRAWRRWKAAPISPARASRRRCWGSASRRSKPSSRSSARWGSSYGRRRRPRPRDNQAEPLERLLDGDAAIRSTSRPSTGSAGGCSRLPWSPSV